MAGSRHASALGIELHGHASHDQAPPPVATATASVGCRHQHPSAQESFTLFIRVNSAFRFELRAMWPIEQPNWIETFALQ